MKESIHKLYIILYLLAVLTSIALSYYGLTTSAIIVAFVKFIILSSYYLTASKKFNQTYLILLALNITGHLIYVKGEYYSLLFSLTVYLVTNLVFSLLIYNFYKKSRNFERFITPFSIMGILLSFALVSFTETMEYLFIIYSLSVVLMVYNGMVYYRKRPNKYSFLMMLGVIIMLISVGFTIVYTFINNHKIFNSFDTLFYGIGLLLITQAVIYEDNNYSSMKNNWL